MMIRTQPAQAISFHSGGFFKGRIQAQNRGMTFHFRDGLVCTRSVLRNPYINLRVITEKTGRRNILQIFSAFSEKVKSMF